MADSVAVSNSTWKSNLQSITGFFESPDRRLALLTAILLIIAASRITQLKALAMDYDDAWSIWQTFGSPAEIIRWTPFDWPPLYFLSVGAWKEVAGIDPLALRYFSALAFLVGVPCLYRAARRVWNERAALLSSLVYGALGYAMYLSLFLRSYGLLLSLLAAAFWLTMRYFDHPTLRRGVVLGALLAVMFYYHYTSFLAFIVLGAYTLVVYRLRVWRWLLPGAILAAAIIPHILAKWTVFSLRTGFYRTVALAPLPGPILKLAQTMVGPAFAWLAILFIAATPLIFWRKAFRWRAVGLALWIAAPVAVYLLQSKLGLFQDPRYMWWEVPGAALWMGCGLSRLPRPATGLIGLSLIGCMFFPNFLDSYQPAVPFGSNFKELRQELRAGDALLIDPSCGRDCGAIEGWDYFIRLYFPEGLTFITSPGQNRRIWYIYNANKALDPATQQALNAGYVPGSFFGPPTFVMRLYEAPPDRQGILFENGMRFHGAELDDPPTPYGPVYRAGEKIHLRLWWSVDNPPPGDFSLNVSLFVNNAPSSTLDGPPQVGGAPQMTSQWTPGHYYVEDREVTLPYPVDKGSYTFYMTVYQSWDNKRLNAPGVNADKLLPIQTINIQAW